MPTSKHTEQGRPAIAPTSSKGLRFASAVCETLFVFGLLIWAYVVVIQIARPAYVPLPFTHHDIFPLNLRLDDTGIIAFVISAISFFGWRILRHYR